MNDAWTFSRDECWWCTDYAIGMDPEPCPQHKPKAITFIPACNSCKAPAHLRVITRSSTTPQCRRCAQAMSDIIEVKFAAL